MAAKEVFGNYHSCNPFWIPQHASIHVPYMYNFCTCTGTQVKKGNCLGTLQNFIRSLGWSWSRKKYFRLRNTGYKKGLWSGMIMLCLKCFRLLAGWLKVPGPGACGAWLTLVFAFLRHGSHPPPPPPRTKFKFRIKDILHRLSYICTINQRWAIRK